jgi:cytochrome P450
VRTEVGYNPFLPEMLANPYPTYRRLREEDPVHYSDVIRSWVLTRYEDVVAAFTDTHFSSNRTTARKFKGTPRTAGGTFQTDPPQHTRVRNLANKAFSPKAIESMQTRVEAIVATLLDRLADNEEVDIIDRFAYPIPMTVISEIIGVPSADHAMFQRWGRRFAPSLDHVFSGRDSTTVLSEMAAYFANLIPERRARPRDDLITALLEVSDGDDRLTDGEVLEVLVFLLFAGHETTVNLIGNGLLSLLGDPVELARVRDEDVSRKCVEELLRFESPAQIIARTVAEDLEWDGYTFRKGDAVVCLLGAANRDPARFREPETLDVARSPNPHVAFGHGPHFCIGAQLSRLEGRVAIPALVRRFPRMRLVSDPPDWRPTAVLRGLNSLRVKLA